MINTNWYEHRQFDIGLRTVEGVLCTYASIGEAMKDINRRPDNWVRFDAGIPLYRRFRRKESECFNPQDEPGQDDWVVIDYVKGGK
jgi:hypothetical protein